MRYKLNVSLSIKGDRVTKGTEIELSDKEVARLDPKDITPVASIVAPEPEVELASISLEEMNHAQLKERAKELGLSAGGSKADLQERITLHLSGNPTEGEQPEGETEPAKVEEGTEGEQPEGEITNG